MAFSDAPFAWSHALARESNISDVTKGGTLLCPFTRALLAELACELARFVPDLLHLRKRQLRGTRQ